LAPRPVAWETAARVAIGLLSKVTGTPPGIVLNVNVADVPFDNVRAVRRADLARFGQVQVIVEQSGKGFVEMALVEPDVTSEIGTDLALLADVYGDRYPAALTHRCGRCHSRPGRR
jgi:5'-nucleotidase